MPNNVVFAAWPSVFITCYNSGFGLDPAVLIPHQMLRGVEKEKGCIHHPKRFGRRLRAGCLLL